MPTSSNIRNFLERWQGYLSLLGAVVAVVVVIFQTGQLHTAAMTEIRSIRKDVETLQAESMPRREWEITAKGIEANTQRLREDVREVKTDIKTLLSRTGGKSP